MDLTITLAKQEWEFILEVIDLQERLRIKEAATNLLKPKLDEAFAQSQNKDNVHT